MRAAVAVLLAAGCAAGADFLHCAAGSGQATFAAPVRVLASDGGTAVDGLEARNFSVKVDGIELPVCGFLHRQFATSLGILMDTSASMRANGVALAKAAIGRILDQSGPGDEFFLMHVGETVEWAEFTSDASSLRPGLDRQAAGKTAVIDAVYVALNGMRKAHHTNRALVVVSDGEDNRSLFRAEELEKAFLLDPIPIFLLWPVDPSADKMWLRHVEESSRTLDLAGKSGGGVWRVTNLRDMLRVASTVGALARSPYMLYVNRPVRESRPKLSVTVKGVKGHPQVAYRGVFRTE